MQGFERAIYTYQSKDPSPTIATDRKKEEKGKTLDDITGASSLCQEKSTGPALETRQAHTIEYRVGKDRPTEKQRG